MKEDIKEAKRLARRAIRQYSQRSEIKRYDDNFDSSLPAAGKVVDMTAIAQGDSALTRDGDTLWCRGLTIRGAILQNASSNFSLVRVMVVRGLQNAGSAYAILDVLETADPLSSYNWEQRKAYKVLKDEVINLSPNYSGGNKIREFETYVPLNFKTIYTTGGTGVEDGGVYIMFISDEATNLHTLHYHARLTYNDS